MTRGSIALAACLTAAALPVPAIESLSLHSASVAVAGTTLHDVTATLAIKSDTRSSLSVQVAQLGIPAALAKLAGPQAALRIDCQDPMIRTPVISCPALQVQVTTPRWPPLRMRGAVAWRSDNGTLTANGTGPDISGSRVRFAVATQADTTRAQLDLPAAPLSELASLLKPWVALPGDLQFSGSGNLSATVERTAGATSAAVALAVLKGAMQNADSTWIAEKIEANVQARVDLSHPERALGIELHAQATHGQMLGGPVLLDFDHNPLDLSAAGTWDSGRLQVTRLQSTQRDLLTATGTADVAFAPLRVRSAQIDASQITFPAAYTSYLQLLLATTPFNQLLTQGRARAELRVQDDQPVQLTLAVDDLGFKDAAHDLSVSGVNSELYWSAGATGPPRPSFLGWKSARGWGIEGAESRIDFATGDRDFRILKPARLPFFDGALLVNTLAVERLGKPDMTGKFDAAVDPISVAPIAKALHWPEFSGRLSGRIPGLTYSDGVLTLGGNLEAQVFDGVVVASNLRVRDPLGKWPRLYADLTARNLDLDLITHTFEFGSITGRLDVDLKGLETFNWSPVAFDLRMATPAGDRSRHRISQRAVQNLSNIGGGGGGVATALQTGALRFFDTFPYDQIGLSCSLRNDVCHMSGVGPAQGGYYILRGWGLPRIDIIGKSTLVDWPRLTSQISSAITNSQGIVVN